MDLQPCPLCRYEIQWKFEFLCFSFFMLFSQKNLDHLVVIIISHCSDERLYWHNLYKYPTLHQLFCATASENMNNSSTNVSLKLVASDLIL
jgi:hypothetical protein